jgi:hypothetical protein
VTPQSSGRYTNPPRSYRRRPPQNSPVVKSLFGGNLPLNTMANAQTQTQNQNQKQWASKLFKPLNMTGILGYPRQMPANMKNGYLNSLVMMWLVLRTI